MGTIQKSENYPKLFIFDMKNNILKIAKEKENTAKPQIGLVNSFEMITYLKSLGG